MWQRSSATAAQVAEAVWQTAAGAEEQGSAQEQERLRTGEGELDGHRGDGLSSSVQALPTGHLRACRLVSSAG